MAAQKGRNIKIKIGNGGTPSTFTSFAGLRTRTISLNNELVDITSDDTAPWREALSGAGLKTMSISGAGVFKDDAAVNLIEDLVMAAASNQQEFQILFENGDTITGTFHVTTFEYSGDYNGAQMYSITLDSVGVLVMSRG